MRRYDKFSRAGLFKAVDKPHSVYRVLAATRRAISFYFNRHIYRLLAIFAIYLLVTDRIFNYLHTQLTRLGLDIDDKFIPVFFDLVSYKPELETVHDALLIEGINSILYHDVARTNIEGRKVYYASGFHLLASNPEIIPIWSNVMQAILAPTIMARVGDLVVNYRNHTYIKNKQRFYTPNPLSTACYNNATNTSNLMRLVKVNTLEEGQDSTLIRLILPVDLIRTDATETSNATETLTQKYEGLLRQVKKNLEHVFKQNNISITELDKNGLSRILFNLVLLNLYQIIQNDIEEFEFLYLNQVSARSSVYYSFADRKASIMYNSIPSLSKKLHVLGTLLTIYTGLQDTENVNYIGAITNVAIPLNRYDVLSVSYKRGKSTRTKLHNALLNLTLLFAAKPDHDVELFISPIYFSKFTKEINDYTKAKLVYEECMKYNSWALSFLLWLCTMALSTMVVCNNHIRTDYGKYLFMYTTHEAWFGYVTLAEALFSVLLYATGFGVVKLAYSPVIFGYARPHTALIKLFVTSFIPYATIQFKRALLKSVLNLVCANTLIYLLDEIAFGQVAPYLPYCITFLDYLGEFIAYTLLYRPLCTHLNLLATIHALFVIVRTEFLNTIKTDKVTVFAHLAPIRFVNGRFVYKVIYHSLYSGLSWVYFSVVNALWPTVAILCWAFIYLKLWNLPYTPEEYTPMY